MTKRLHAPFLSRAALAAVVAACGGEEGRENTALAAESTGVTIAPAEPPAVGDTPSRVDSSATPAWGRNGGAPARVPPDSARTVASAQLDVPRLLRRTSEAYAGMRTLQSPFTMVTENPLLRSRVSSRGTLYQRRPDRILLRFDEPKGDIILGDGQYFWIYYPSTDPDQAIRARAAEGAAGGVDLWAQFVGDPVTRFEHTFHGLETVNGRESAAVTLVPRTDPGYQQLKVWIDTADRLVRRFEITEHNGVIRRIELQDLTVNPALADDVFRFVPPPGVRVVERG